MRRFALTFIGASAIAIAGSNSVMAMDLQPCSDGTAKVQDASVTWGTRNSCGGLVFAGASMLLGKDAKTTTLHIDTIQYAQLPKPGAGILVTIKNSRGVALGSISFGGLHQSCNNDGAVTRLVANESDFDFSRAGQADTATLSVIVGTGNWARC
jgi:hypothetical protein